MRKLRSIVFIGNTFDNLINENLVRSSGIARHVLSFDNTSKAFAFFQTLEKNAGFIEEIIPELVFIDMKYSDKFSLDLALLDSKLTKQFLIVLLCTPFQNQEFHMWDQCSNETQRLYKPISEEALVYLHKKALSRSEAYKSRAFLLLQSEQ